MARPFALPEADVAGGDRLLVQDLDADFDETLRIPRGERSVAPERAAGDKHATCSSADVDVAVYGTGGITLLENLFVPAMRSRTLVPTPLDNLPPPVSGVTGADRRRSGR
jgi:hypothetical protein